MKLMIAVPTTDYIHADFVKSLVDLEAELNRQKISHKVEILSGTLVYIARNKLAQKAVNDGYTHVLWLDSDMVFNDQVVDDLQFCGKEMVCGAFVSRRPPYGPCVYTSIRKYDIKKVEKFGTEPFRVDGCGFACVMTTTELLLAVMLFYAYGVLRRRPGILLAGEKHRTGDLVRADGKARAYCTQAGIRGRSAFRDNIKRRGEDNNVCGSERAADFHRRG